MLLGLWATFARPCAAQEASVLVAPDCALKREPIEEALALELHEFGVPEGITLPPLSLSCTRERYVLELHDEAHNWHLVRSFELLSAEPAERILAIAASQMLVAWLPVTGPRIAVTGTRREASLPRKPESSPASSAPTSAARPLPAAERAQDRPAPRRFQLALLGGLRMNDLSAPQGSVMQGGRFLVVGQRLMAGVRVGTSSGSHDYPLGDVSWNSYSLEGVLGVGQRFSRRGLWKSSLSLGLQRTDARGHSGTEATHASATHRLGPSTALTLELGLMLGALDVSAFAEAGLAWPVETGRISNQHSLRLGGLAASAGLAVSAHFGGR